MKRKLDKDLLHRSAYADRCRILLEHSRQYNSAMERITAWMFFDAAADGNRTARERMIAGFNAYCARNGKGKTVMNAAKWLAWSGDWM